MLSETLQVRHVVAWLTPVRMVTCAIVWIAFGVALVPRLDLPLREAIPFGLTAAFCRTLVLAPWPRGARTDTALRGVSCVADVALLTILLDLTGGPFNPFIVMYAIYIWLAGAALSTPWMVTVAAASVAGFGWLVIDHVQADLREHHRLNDFPTHLFTMWFAAATVAELVAYYVSRARTVLDERQRLLDAERVRAERSERLAALTTLAAGAAHELSTPLGTIAVAARELERHAAPPIDAKIAVALQDDATLIRSEVDRCRAILDAMSGRANGGMGSTLAPLSPSEIARLLSDRFTQAQRRRLTIHVAPDAPTPSSMGAEVVQTLASLVRNAFDASGDGQPVTVSFDGSADVATIRVEDAGHGMSPETWRRAGEPFFTTKGAGRGMGLGLFLARSFAERAGGGLDFESSPRGTTAVLRLPAVSSRAEHHD